MMVLEKTLRSGLKPATSIKGLILSNNNFEEIYISPKSNYALVEALLKKNHKI